MDRVDIDHLQSGRHDQTGDFVEVESKSLVDVDGILPEHREPDQARDVLEWHKSLLKEEGEIAVPLETTIPERERQVRVVDKAVRAKSFRIRPERAH